jgi:hypothetical protein
VKYNLYLKSVAAINAAHETGVIHGIRLYETVEYKQLIFIFNLPVFGDAEEEAENIVNSDILAGPSMLTFYENLGRVVRGEWWLYANPDSTSDFRSKCTRKIKCFFLLASYLSNDLFGYTLAKGGRDDPTFVTSCFNRLDFLVAAPDFHGFTMSAEAFLELYESIQRRADITDRKRMRRQCKTECLFAFRNKFHK